RSRASRARPPGADRRSVERPREGWWFAPGTYRRPARRVHGGFRRLPPPGLPRGGPRPRLQRRALLPVSQQSGAGRPEHALACGRHAVRPHERRILRSARRAWRLTHATQGDHAECAEVVPPEANVVIQRVVTSTFGAGLVEAIPDQQIIDR